MISIFYICCVIFEVKLEEVVGRELIGLRLCTDGELLPCGFQNFEAELWIRNGLVSEYSK